MRENPSSSYILNTSFSLEMVLTAHIVEVLQKLCSLYLDFVAAGENMPLGIAQEVQCLLLCQLNFKPVHEKIWEDPPVFSSYFQIQAVYGSINTMRQSQRAGGGGRGGTVGWNNEYALICSYRTEDLISFYYKLMKSSY